MLLFFPISSSTPTGLSQRCSEKEGPFCCLFIVKNNNKSWWAMPWGVFSYILSLHRGKEIQTLQKVPENASAKSPLLWLYNNRMFKGGGPVRECSGHWLIITLFPVREFWAFTYHYSLPTHNKLTAATCSFLDVLSNSHSPCSQKRGLVLGCHNNW